MKSFTLMLMSVCFFANAFGQADTCRYIQTDYFENVHVTEDVTYGVNATLLYFPIVGEAVEEPLLMDVYEPAFGDGTPEGNALERPLIIVIHGGTFLPPGPDGNMDFVGDKADIHIVELCERFARMGYVVASINHRLGWNPFAEPQEVATESIIQAAYRGIQDLRTCIRYFRKDYAENNNTFGIDPEKIAVLGEHSGGYIALGAATLDDYQKLTSSPKFFKQTTNGPVPMIIEEVHGDITGENWGIVPDANGNPVDTLCIPNHVGYSSDFDLCINLVGALPESSWIDDNTIPIISFHDQHATEDPCETGIVLGPIQNSIIEVDGSCVIQPLQDNFGNNAPFEYQLEDGSFLFNSDIFITANAPSNISYGFYMLNSSDGIIDPWRWCENPNLPCDPPYDQNQANAMTFLDTIVDFVTPRAFFALQLTCDAIVNNTNEVRPASYYQITTAPNPARDQVILEAPDDDFQAITLYNLNGSAVASFENINTNRFHISRNNLPAGIYLAKITFEDGITTQKIVFE